MYYFSWLLIFSSFCELCTFHIYKLSWFDDNTNRHACNASVFMGISFQIFKITAKVMLQVFICKYIFLELDKVFLNISFKTENKNRQSFEHKDNVWCLYFSSTRCLCVARPGTPIFYIASISCHLLPWKQWQQTWLIPSWIGIRSLASFIKITKYLEFWP